MMQTAYHLLKVPPNTLNDVGYCLPTGNPKLDLYLKYLNSILL